MKKYRLAIIVVIFLLVVPFTIQFGDSFFTTAYYKTPKKAFNVDSGHVTGYGWVEVDKEIGVVTLDDNTCLFLGEFGENQFVIDLMATKKGKYASKGRTIYCDTETDDAGIVVEQTQRSGGYKWSAIYHESDIGKISELENVARTEKFEHSNGKPIYIVIYE